MYYRLFFQWCQDFIEDIYAEEALPEDKIKLMSFEILLLFIERLRLELLIQAPEEVIDRVLEANIDPDAEHFEEFLQAFEPEVNIIEFAEKVFEEVEKGYLEKEKGK